MKSHEEFLTNLKEVEKQAEALDNAWKQLIESDRYRDFWWDYAEYNMALELDGRQGVYEDFTKLGRYIGSLADHLALMGVDMLGFLCECRAMYDKMQKGQELTSRLSKDEDGNICLLPPDKKGTEGG